LEHNHLYLDTARLGRMSRRAQHAHVDLSRLAGEEAGSVFFERFLVEGSRDWCSTLRCRYPGLECWQGVAPLKEGLRALAGSTPTLPVLMVNRLSQLMRFAARLLFHPCRNVLVTDLGWPPYHEILDSEARRAGRAVTTARLKTWILEGKVIDVIRRRFLEADCDGLFLTSVSHLGIRLPVERLVRALEDIRKVRLVVVDGAQHFCHVAADLSNEYCDLYLAGSHKWLQGFHPMGLGFYGRQRSRATIETVLKHLLASGELDDPLLRFTTQLETAVLDGVTETVNVFPLFTCQGAVAEALESSVAPPPHLGARQQNLAKAAELAESCGWRPVQATSPFASGILLLEAERESTRGVPAQHLRRSFAANGIALTAYDGGLIRLSMPGEEWQPAEIEQLRMALHAVA